MHAALLIARLLLGLGMATHGAQKLFGWFRGYGRHNTGELMVQIGFPRGSGTLFATAAGLGELGGGLLVALGLGGPIGAALMILVMLVAAGTVNAKHGFFAANNGVELPLVYAAGALLLAFTGPGRWSADHLFELDYLTTPRHAWIAVAVAAVAALANLVMRRSSSPAAAS